MAIKQLKKTVQRVLERLITPLLNKREQFKILNYANINITEKSFLGVNVNSVSNHTKIILHGKSKQKNENNTLLFIDENGWIGEYCEINLFEESYVKIGKWASIQDFCKIIGNVSIGNYSLLAPNVFISSGNHSFRLDSVLPIRIQDRIASEKNNDKPVVIEEDCWIGKNAVILAGSYIGRGSIIGANSVIKGVINPYSIVSNNLQIKKRFLFEPLSVINACKEHIPYFYKGFKQVNYNGTEVDYENGFQFIENSFFVLKDLDREYEMRLEIFNKSNESCEIQIFNSKNQHVCLKLHEGLNNILIAQKQYSLCSDITIGNWPQLEHPAKCYYVQLNETHNIYLKQAGHYPLN